MLATAIIVFREVLEAALIVGIVMAAARGATTARALVGSGIAVRVLGALGVAAAASTIAAMARASVRIVRRSDPLRRVLMLGWHNVWMARPRGGPGEQCQAARSQCTQWRAAVVGLGFAVGLAVLREGSETVLFLTASRCRPKAGDCRWFSRRDRPGAWRSHWRRHLLGSVSLPMRQLSR